MSVSINPLEARILVQPLDAEQTTASGLVIPDTAKEKPQEGTVLAVGPGRFDDEGENRIPLDIGVGDIVIYSKYGGTEVKYDNEEYLILSARDVLAIVEKFGGGPVGVENLASAIGEERDTIEDVLEPYLIQQGYLHRTPRGRMATALTYRHFGLAGGPAPATGGLFE